MEMLEITIKAHHCFRIIIRRLGPGLAQLVRFTFLSVRIIWLLIVTTSDVESSRIGAEGAKVGGGVDDEEAVDQVEVEAGVRPRIPPTWSSIGVTIIMIIIIVMIMMMTISITEMILDENLSRAPVSPASCPVLRPLVQVITSSPPFIFNFKLILGISCWFFTQHQAVSLSRPLFPLISFPRPE